jgi:hypothetical protein
MSRGLGRVEQAVLTLLRDSQKPSLRPLSAEDLPLVFGNMVRSAVMYEEGVIFVRANKARQRTKGHAHGQGCA